jgi:hypothetical protein
MFSLTVFAVVLTAATVLAQDPDRQMYLVGVDEECVGDQFFINTEPDGVDKFWCDIGLRCVVDEVDYQPITTTGAVGVCQPLYRRNGYTPCNPNPSNSNCRDAQCCEAGLFCPPSGSPNAGVCAPELGEGGDCQFGNNNRECKRGYICNVEQNAPIVSGSDGKCTKAQSVGRNMPATHPDLCESGLILLRGSGPTGINVCVRPEDVACGSDFSDIECGNFNGFTENRAMNSLDRYMSDNWSSAYGNIFRINKAYTCNERSQCEATNTACNGWMSRLLSKNSGGPRNELGLSTFTSTRYEECQLFHCLTGRQGTLTSADNSEIYQCSDESRPKAEEGTEATSSQLAGAVFGTAIVSGLIGAALWKYNGGSFSIPGRA